jgi:hypothetical protein
MTEEINDYVRAFQDTEDLYHEFLIGSTPSCVHH